MAKQFLFDKPWNIEAKVISINTGKYGLYLTIEYQNEIYSLGGISIHNSIIKYTNLLNHFIKTGKSIKIVYNGEKVSKKGNKYRDIRLEF